MFKIIHVLFFVVLIFSLKQEALACASCGSGGDDPLILYPNESLKYYLGASRTGGFKVIDINGEEGKDGGPRFKDAFQFALGKSINESAFVTLYLPYMYNRNESSSQGAMGDPSLSLRWSPYLQNIAEPYWPQVQVLLSYKYALSRSIRESTRMNDLLDVFGNGFTEAKFGLDVFWGMQKIKYGFAQTFSTPFGKQFRSAYVDPGMSLRTTLMGGYGDSWGKILVGLNRESAGNLKVNGEEVLHSKVVTYTPFVTSDWMIGPGMLRLTFSRKAIEGFENRNTSRAFSVTTSWMQALQ